MKGRKKLKALAKIFPFMNIHKNKVLIKTIFTAQLSYCPLTYNTINKRKFYLRAVKPVSFGSETLSHLAPKIWELVPVEIKGLVR